MRAEMHGMAMSQDRIRQITEGQIELLRPHVIP